MEMRARNNDPHSDQANLQKLLDWVDSDGGIRNDNGILNCLLFYELNKKYSREPLARKWVLEFNWSEIQENISAVKKSPKHSFQSLIGAIVAVVVVTTMKSY